MAVRLASHAPVRGLVDTGGATGWQPHRKGPNRPTGTALREFFENRHLLDGVGLCLSGGGFRAALFHLGSLRRLNELGILSRVTMVLAVSGGAILAAHLAEKLGAHWPEPGTRLSDGDWESVVARPFRAEVASRNLRTKALLLGPWSAAERLAQQYVEHITEKKLSELPACPEFLFRATELIYRRSWISSQQLVGCRATGLFAPTDDWTVARAVAVSSCFPPVFLPMSVWDLVPPQHQHPGLPKKRLLLSDGGVYDNLGYLALWNRCRDVLVSDGGGVLDINDGKEEGGDIIGRVGRAARPDALWRLRRYQAVQEYSGRGWQKGFLLGNLLNGHQQGAYWGIRTNAVAHFGRDPQDVYPRDLVENFIAKVRTDLDAFTEGEQGVLENHGYLQAAAAANCHLGHLATLHAPLRPPHENCMDAAEARRALCRSCERRLLPLPW